MEERDHHQHHRRAQNGSTQLAASAQATEPAARSRWTPKPEQILILESIFNSGMVNPPKDETVRIRKLLEKFGAVGDANVFYWFQNRRSRSRRRQRQIQAAIASAATTHNPLQLPLVPATFSSGSAPGAFQLYEFGSSSTAGAGLLPSNCSSKSHQFSALQEPSCCGGVGASTSYGVVIGGGCDGAGVFSTACSQMVVSEVDQGPIYYSSDGSSMHCQTEFVSVFINGVATEVPKGPFDAKAMFGESVVLVHSSGIPVLPPQSLQQGESYFLVSRHA